MQFFDVGTFHWIAQAHIHQPMNVRQGFHYFADQFIIQITRIY